MTSGQPAPLLFLNHLSTDSFRKERQLDTRAKAHASRQGHQLKSTQPKHFKFVSCFSRGGTGRDSGLAETKASTKPSGRPAKSKSTPKRGRPNDQDASQLLPRGISPRGIGVGVWDPFNSLIVPNLAQDEHFMLHYAFSTTWSAFGESEGGKNTFVQHWMWRTMENPATLYAQLLGSSTHYVLSCSESMSHSHTITMGLQWKAQAIQALRCEIDGYQAFPDVAIADSALVAIFVLAVHGGFDLSPQPEPHPLSPLATYRDMHIYGKMTFAEEHVRALYTFIEQRGGLGHIDQPTFGCVMHLLDMLYNARLGSVPRFPCDRQLQTILQTELWQPDQKATHLLKILGKAFRPALGDESSGITSQLNQNMTDVLATMAEITVALDHFHRGGSGAPESLDVLANNCDWVSHKLLSTTSYLTPDVDELNAGQLPMETGPVLREICRLSSLIFLDMIILPTPPHAQIKYRHSLAMLPLVSALQGSEWNADGCVSEFLIWATMLGAVASRFTELHGSYLDLVYEYQARRCSTWETIRPRINRHLWLDCILQLSVPVNPENVLSSGLLANAIAKRGNQSFC
ncbi:hypothetical protein BKA56DRAFT_636921 [Ilyonectria sp. MPI-CAGE-AT-0026]|nr:hypothetical protein BKA56DRAFT_636921 [Ilyonectria sp. MPI-CAGE-AT-0026]